MKKFRLKAVQRTSNFSIDYKNDLNEAQFKAVSSSAKRQLILAGAGTGKTKTLVYKVAWLIESGVPAEHIVLLTFTRRAAQEMMNRATEILDERCQRIKGGTFHSFCTQILREHGTLLGISNDFTILDTSDTHDVLHHLRSKFVEKKKGERYPNKQTLAKLFSLKRNKQIDICVLLQQYYPQFIKLEDSIHELYKAFESYKSIHHLLDFDDLLTKTLQLFDENPRVGEQIASTCEYLLVDEYQDTNTIQSLLCEAFSSIHQKITVVGDDAQSIYSFRGASYENIRNFPASEHPTELTKLEQNYRSTPQILNFANELLKQSHNLFEKNLFTQRNEGELPAIIPTLDQIEEAEFLTQYVLHLREHQLEFKEMAVLFRNASDSYQLELALNAKNIPFQKFGGQKFTEAAHIKDLLAYLRVLNNPNDTLAWQRLLMNIDGIGPKNAEDLFLWIQQSSSNETWFQSEEWMTKSYYNELKSLSKVLLEAFNCTPWHESITILTDYYRPICKRKYDDAEKRMDDLDVLEQIAKPYASMNVFLNDMVLEPITESVIDTQHAIEEESPLILSTIHSAKGLEWRHVFIINCLDGIIPSMFAMDSDEGIDEELRLLYVAATRAKDMLYFSHPITSYKARTGEYLTKMSRFLEPVKQVMEPWVLEHDIQEKEDFKKLES